MRIPLLLCATMLCGLAVNGAAAPQEEGKRVALVIGNDAYLTRPLQNAINDARLVDKVLKASGFNTILKENAKKAEMEEALAEFLGQLGPDDTALFYYAGHGVQIENENLLVPVDFEPGSTITLSKFRCFPFNLVIESLKRVRHKRSIFILDACRSNPMTESQSLQSGLAIPPDAGGDSLVIYSTNANNVAADNPGGRNSYFTEALADLIAQPGLPISDIVARVTKRVLQETDNRQNPTIFGSPTSRFYFHPPSNLDSESDPTLVEKWMSDAKLREQHQDWQQAIDLMSQVVKKKPGGSLEEMASAKLPYLEARKDAQTRFEAEDFKAAAGLYDQAYKLDLFAIDAAFQGVASNLLGDRMDEAVRLLRAIRVRGTTAQIRKADAMLKELAAVYPDAGKELQSPPPQPPPITEIFSSVRFGTPDFDAGQRFLAATPVDLSRWAKELSAAATATAGAGSRGGRRRNSRSGRGGPELLPCRGDHFLEFARSDDPQGRGRQSEYQQCAASDGGAGESHDGPSGREPNGRGGPGTEVPVSLHPHPERGQADDPRRPGRIPRGHRDAGCQTQRRRAGLAAGAGDRVPGVRRGRRRDGGGGGRQGDVEAGAGETRAAGGQVRDSHRAGR